MIRVDCSRQFYLCLCVGESLLSVKPSLLQDLAPMASLVVIECREWVSFVLCPSREATLALTDFPQLQMARLCPGSFPLGLFLHVCVNNVFTSVSDRAVMCYVAQDCETKSV